jgi:hypothetical protein
VANLVSYTIPSLIQGISQQPDAQREPSQGEVQINGVSSLAEGLRKRECTASVAKVSTASFGDVYFHQILRDTDEQYLVVIGKTAIKVFGLDGSPKTVTAPYGYGYLSSVVSAKKDIRAATIADYTFVSNTKAIPAMDAALAPKVARPSVHEALVWIKAANYGQTYRLLVNSVQATVATSVAPVIVSGTTTTENRISTAEIASQLRGLLVGGPVTALTVVGSATTLNGTVTSVATTTDEGGQGLTVTVTGNGTVVTAVVVGAAAGAGYMSGNKVFVRRDLLQGGTDQTPVQVATVNTITAGPLTGVTIDRSGSVLHLKSSSAITLAASDARANADITAITSSVQAFTELPTIAPQGYQVEILGDPGNRFDGYYVEFVPRSGAGTFGEGAWAETVSPGVEYKLDPTTMPHLLVRLPDGTFYFGPANGTTQGGVAIPGWGERTAGDYDTAPDPSFVGYPIQDVFIYKNRLGVLADENIVLSRAREFFDFFPGTVTAVLDSDPIDLKASNNRVSVLRYAIPYQDELIIFSDQIQFRFNAAETVLTPATAQITVLTQYEIDPDCRPIPVQGTIIFCQTNGQWSQFREFSVRGAGTALVADASDLTGYVSSYIPSDVFKLAGNDTGNAWFAISEKSGYADRIYVYKYFYRNSGNGAERAQSSWSYWRLNGADKILSILCVQEAMYLLVEYGTEVWLEKMPVSDRLSNVAPSPYPLLLDRRVSTTTDTPAAIRVAAGTYNATTKQTTWTLPYAIRSLTQAWSGFSATSSGGVLLGSATSGSTIVARGDWSAAPVFFGEVYEFVYRFTRFKLYKEVGGGKTAANVERTQVRHAKLRYHETSYFEAWVMAERREKAVYKFDGTVLGSRNSVLGTQQPNGFDPEDNRYFEGVFQIPIASKGENCIVEIHNDTVHPCKFSTCEWVGLLTSQARSLQ